MRNVYKISAGDHLGELGIDARITTNQILEK
jgi:hypothetical protein